MKKLYPILIISLLFLLVGCSTDFTTLQKRGDTYYEINSEKPFSGSVFDKYESGQYSMKGFIKKGNLDGDWTKWYGNGQKSYEGTYKDGEVISKKFWNKDGSVKE